MLKFRNKIYQIPERSERANRICEHTLSKWHFKDIHFNFDNFVVSFLFFLSSFFFFLKPERAGLQTSNLKHLGGIGLSMSVARDFPKRFL